MAISEKKVAELIGIDLFGLSFTSPVGSGPDGDPLATRYNKFRPCSFVETGPLYPLATGSERPLPWYRKLFAERRKSSLTGVKTAIDNISSKPPKTLIMANIAALPMHLDCESVTSDLLSAFTYLYDFVDMFVIDTFRKNNDGVAPLQSLEFLSESIDELLDIRLCYEKQKPVFLRVTNDVSDTFLAPLLDYMMYSGLDGIVAGREGDPLPLVSRIGDITRGRYPIIACGSIDTVSLDTMQSQGVKLVQTDKANAKSIISYLTTKLSQK